MSDKLAAYIDNFKRRMDTKGSPLGVGTPCSMASAGSMSPRVVAELRADVFGTRDA